MLRNILQALLNQMKQKNFFNHLKDQMTSIRLSETRLKYLIRTIQIDKALINLSTQNVTVR